MTFVLSEVLLQALTLMNSPQQRGRRAHAETPRRLRRIVLTLPTGMPLAERLIFRKRAEAARDLVWMMMGWKLDDPAAPAPRVLTDWDEASCTQLVYLYTEVARNFGGDARRFFQITAKPRGRPADGTLSIASIDVGGGTTDLIINSYHLEGAGTSVTLFPEQKFREGFNVAGDDILLRVVQGHVLPPIEAAMRSAGIANPTDLMAELVGGDRGGEDVIQRNLRQQFALQIAHPLALEFMRAAETYDPTSGVVAAEPRPYESFFSEGSKPSEEVVTFVNEAARKRGAKDFDLKATVFPVDLPSLDKTVRAEMARVLAPLAEIVHAYDCDVLLLSGRPSRLPGIRSLVMELLPLPPERVISLHEYRVGAWYPFRDARLRVEDPKTTVAVGAMIAALGAVAAARLLLPLRPAAVQEHRQVHRQARRRRPPAARGPGLPRRRPRQPRIRAARDRLRVPRAHVAGRPPARPRALAGGPALRAGVRQARICRAPCPRDAVPDRPCPGKAQGQGFGRRRALPPAPGHQPRRPRRGARPTDASTANAAAP